MKFSRAIVRKPGRSIINAISTSNLGQPVYDNALIQHDRYIEVLTRCGLDVLVLDPDEEHPDSVFIEDPAVVIPGCAIITRPGAASRLNETKDITEQLSLIFKNIEYIESPGTIEGGDVLRVNDHFYIGISARTNLEGAEQMTLIFEKYGYTASSIPLKEFLHLKTGVSFLNDDLLLVAGELSDCKYFERFRKLTVPCNEIYAANCLNINGTVLFPSGYPTTLDMIKGFGFDIIELDMSEFRKADGGLSCLSLRF